MFKSPPEPLNGLWLKKVTWNCTYVPKEALCTLLPTLDALSTQFLLFAIFKGRMFKSLPEQPNGFWLKKRYEIVFMSQGTHYAPNLSTFAIFKNRMFKSSPEHPDGFWLKKWHEIVLISPRKQCSMHPYVHSGCTVHPIFLTFPFLWIKFSPETPNEFWLKKVTWNCTYVSMEALYTLMSTPDALCTQFC